MGSFGAPICSVEGGGPALSLPQLLSSLLCVLPGAGRMLISTGGLWSSELQVLAEGLLGSRCPAWPRTQGRVRHEAVKVASPPHDLSHSILSCQQPPGTACPLGFRRGDG